VLDKYGQSTYIIKSEYKRILNMKDFIKVMKALSDPNRVKIVKMLQHKTMCVCEMREALQVSQPTVSKSLKILEDAGLVDFKKDGLWVDYHLTDGSKSPYVASLLGNLRHWMENEAEVRELIEKIPHIRREEVCKK
jgi:ArsR family transcriptional regulator